MDTVVKSRKTTDYTGKVHNPRKIHDEMTRRTSQASREEFAATSREQTGKRLDSLEANFNKMVEVAKGQNESIGQLTAQIEGLEKTLVALGKKLAKAE